jgi:hypothetical protein
MKEFGIKLNGVKRNGGNPKKWCSFMILIFQILKTKI